LQQTEVLKKIKCIICSAPQSYYRSYDEYIQIGSPIHPSSASQIHSQSPQQQTPSSVSSSSIHQPHSPSMLTSNSPSINQYGYSTVLPSSIMSSHQDVMSENQQWNCGINGSPTMNSYQNEFCATNYSIMQRQQYGGKIGPGNAMKSIKEARIRRPMNGELIC
jgi:hypothetical protein